MNKFAQDRGILNKLREKTNISSKILESLNPEFQELMDNLRATDEKIRTLAEQVKPLVRASKSHVNRRDYLSAATNISAFHERCRYISAELHNFIKSVDLKHYKFLLDQFDDEQKEQLFGYDPNKEINTDASLVDDKIITAALKKQAGLSDWWFSATDPLADLAHNLTTNRGNAMRALEKRFSISFLKQLKASSVVMVSRTEKFLQVLLLIFKKLASALATRNVDRYVDTAKTFINKFAEYHKQFLSFYETNIVPLREQNQKLIDAAKEVERLKAEEIAEKSSTEEQEAQRALRDQRRRQGLPATDKGPHTGVGVRVNEAPTQEDPNALQKQKEQALKNLQKSRQDTIPDMSGKQDTLVDENYPIDLMKKKNSQFISKIEKLALIGDEKNLGLAILAHSEFLEESAPQESLKLLAIAEGIFDNKPDNDFPANENGLGAPKKKDEIDITPQRTRKDPIVHNIPEGIVNKKYSSLDALAKVSADKIKTSVGAADHIGKIFVKRLYDLGINPGHLNPSFEFSIIKEVRNAVVRGYVLTNRQSEDSHNPLDRQLEVLSYLKMENIDPTLKGIIKLKILCRFSLTDGTVSLRTIQKNFMVE